MKLILIFLASLHLFASNEDQVCKSCHPNIYNEFKSSIHSKSSKHDDEIHKVVWDTHPDKKANNYTCKECHSSSQNEASISCLSCHQISDISKHTEQNENKRTTKKKYFYSADISQKGTIKEFKKDDSFMGLFSKNSGSPYHTIDYSNQNYYDGQMCMGCHSHKTNKKGIDACRIDDAEISKNGNNCITCHMPQIKGSSTSIKITKTHAFHGFAGVHNAPQMLGKYLKMEIVQTKKGFEVLLHNNSPHPFLLQPLRMAVLDIQINSKKLKPTVFARVLGDDENKPTMPWDATKVLSDTMLKADEHKSFYFDEKLKRGDKIEAQFGFFVVNPKAKEKLELQNNKTANKFIVFKTITLKIKEPTAQ